MKRARRLAVAALLTTCLASSASPALADHSQESIFQDDDHLVYSPPSTVANTLATLKAIGVQRLRVTLKWSDLAPGADRATKPAGFNAADPSAYPAGVFDRYDLLVLLAAQYGLAVQFNITAPGPLWAMAPGAPSARAADHFVPDPAEFESFVHAVGERYSGTYRGLPRVSSWSVWNEPNQPGWLAPQWVSAGGRPAPASPRLYRSYVRAAYLGLRYSGHSPSRDQILVGELAPEGSTVPGSYTAMTPMQFLRGLYCLSARYAVLRGRKAVVLGCPAAGRRRDFVDANPLLFAATGFAHHPYDFFLGPAVSSPDRNFVPLANLQRLERGLDRSFRAYGVRRRIPIELTEYGYQTNPPDPFQVVTPAQQAVYLNEADYLAWRDSRVRSVAQFLLYDAGPDPLYAPSDFNYWDTFQTGLLFADGSPKPAYAAYQMPIWVPSRRAARGRSLLIWGQVRAVTHFGPQRAQIQWRPAGGSFRTIQPIVVRNPSGYLAAHVRLPRSGAVRIGWRSAAGSMLLSRSVAVRIG